MSKDRLPECKLVLPMQKDNIENEGEIIAVLKGGFYKIRLGNNTEVLAKLCGNMRRHHIKIVVADKVLVELSPYDLGRGRVTYRL